MKKRFICFILLFFVCIAFVIPKTHAFGIVDSYPDDDIYYAPFEYSINILYSDGLDSYSYNTESITFPYETISQIYTNTLNFNNNFYWEEYYASGNDTIKNFNFSIYPLQPYEYFYTGEFATYGDPSFFNIKMNVPLLVLNYNIATMFSIQYYDSYCNVNDIYVTMDLRYIKNGDVYTTTESLNLIDSVDSDMLVYQPLLYTYNALYSKYEVTEFVITNYNLILNMNSDSQFYYISHPLFVNGYAFEVPYLVTEVEEIINPDFSSWLVSGVGGFMNFEIIPGWSIAVILSIMIGVPLLIYILRLFFGG